MTAVPARLSDRSPKGEQLRDILEALIADRQAGETLPSERHLAERYAVARMTVRAEIDRLVADGLLYRVRGRGTFVAEPRMVAGAVLGSFTEDMRARGLVPGSRVLAQELVAADDVVARRHAVAPGAPLVRIHRVRTADGEPIAVEEAFLPARRFPGLEAAELGEGSLFELLERRWGVGPATADQRVAAVSIDRDQAALLGVPAALPGFLFRTVARDASGQPLTYSSTLYRGDRYEIALTATR